MQPGYNVTDRLCKCNYHQIFG